MFRLVRVRQLWSASGDAPAPPTGRAVEGVRVVGVVGVADLHRVGGLGGLRLTLVRQPFVIPARMVSGQRTVTAAAAVDTPTIQTGTDRSGR